jgi:uncharacterized protein (UPF0335 family)
MTYEEYNEQLKQLYDRLCAIEDEHKDIRDEIIRIASLIEKQSF